MKSPFPGMDPYLEQHWGDVHHNLITFAQGMLNDSLPGDLRARVEERVLVEIPNQDERAYIPDVRIIERERSGSGGTATAADASATPPATGRTRGDFLSSLRA